MNFFDKIAEYFSDTGRIMQIFRILLIVGIGFPVIKMIVRLLGRAIKDKLSAQAEQLILRLVYYLGILVILVSILNEFGFKLSVLLGAAGVFGLAIGFASQTSISNVISGFFLISERPFMVGDVIQVGTTTGAIESIDLLSIKLKTPDSRFVRIPNETMIKSEVINITRYPIRQVNITVGVAYKENLRRVRSILAEIADREPLALKDPAPAVWVDQFGNSSVVFTFGVWCNKDDFFITKTSLMIAIKERFDAEGIEIPFPHLSLYTGKATTALPIEIQNRNSL